jgi:hypothetical protein
MLLPTRSSLRSCPRLAAFTSLRSQIVPHANPQPALRRRPGRLGPVSERAAPSTQATTLMAIAGSSMHRVGRYNHGEDLETGSRHCIRRKAVWRRLRPSVYIIETS